ncbi:hypothetical protein [Pseudomonas corrugata]|uniref:hypothetical protein n=1 Tax=Pseudomonas corrugata TaxID=47879 RepID=UPI00223418A3|nr:hypothetical protein [Pseudomonas corrugata]UZE08489.1 hypothetical protein LOY65_11460 [Pseudomonas corrugata]
MRNPHKFIPACICRVTSERKIEKRGQIYFSNPSTALKKYICPLFGYVRLIGGGGSAKYGVVGLDRATWNITTFHVKSASELARKAPSLGVSK